MEESEHIKKLEEMIPKLDNLVVVNSPTVEYDVEKGTAFGINLFNIPEIAVQRVFMSKGTVFPEHKHDECEYVLVYKGSVKLHIEEDKPHICVSGKSVSDKTAILGVADGFYVAPGVAHAGEALEDTWMMSIAIPSGKGYPDE